MKAVLFADTIQMVVVYVGIISVLIKGSVEVEGFGNAWNIADKNGRIVLWE